MSCTVRSGRYGYTETSSGYPPASANQGVKVRSNPREALEDVNAFLENQGYTRVGPAQHNRFLPNNGVVAHAIEAEVEHCYIAVAFSPAGSDLNLIVLDPTGRTQTYNVAPDPYPWVAFCPPQAGRYIARLQMAAGQGEYFYALYRANPGTPVNLGSFLGGQGESVPFVEMDAATNARMQRWESSVAKERFKRAGDPQGLRLRTGEERAFELPYLEQGRCYAYTLFGGMGVAETTMVLVDGSGALLERDTTRGPDASLRYCPSRSGSYFVRLRLDEGQGPVFVAGYVQQKGSEGTPQSRNVIARGSTSRSTLDDTFRLVDGEMVQARGYRRFGPAHRAELTENARREVSLKLQGGECYAVLAVGEHTIKNLDLSLLDDKGRKLDEDLEDHARPVVRACPSKDGEYRVQLHARQGQGPFIYAAYRWSRGTKGPFGLEGLTYLRLAEITSLLSVEGYEPDPDYTPARGEVRQGKQGKSHKLTLKAGFCYALVVVGGEGVSNLDLRLSKGGETVAQDGTRTAFPNVRTCAGETDQYVLNLQAVEGSGPYFYQVFRRTRSK